MPYMKQMEIVTDVDKLSVDLQSTFMKYSSIKEWAYIIHDKDDTRPHYHIYLNFGRSSQDVNLVAEWFKIPSNFINKVKGKKTDMLLYLTHSNDSQKHKHQYDISEVTANFDFETEIENSKIIGDFERFSYAQQLKYVNSLSIVEKTKAYAQLNKLWEVYCKCQCLEADRDIQVVFITGKAGCGKTTYAKLMLDRLGYDYCVSSSSNDPFQDYLGQKAIILDDLRDSAFSLEDILKITDNNTKSSVKSRFSNKVFNGKMIVITSSVPIQYWYPIYKQINSMDDLSQFYRRISTYIIIGSVYIQVYDDGLNSMGCPIGTPTSLINEIDKIKKEKKEKVSIGSIFKDIHEVGIENLVKKE